MPDFGKLAELAVNEQWKGTRLERVLFVFWRFEQPLPVDLELYANTITKEPENEE